MRVLKFKIFQLDIKKNIAAFFSCVANINIFDCEVEYFDFASYYKNTHIYTYIYVHREPRAQRGTGRFSTEGAIRLLRKRAAVALRHGRWIPPEVTSTASKWGVYVKHTDDRSRANSLVAHFRALSEIIAVEISREWRPGEFLSGGIP